jgi:sirohydrochlorin cobaltochelatase
MRRASVLAACCFALAFAFCSQAIAGHGGHERPEKRGILLAAFGTTVPEARAALENAEEEVRKAFPDLPVRWAYTSHQVRRKLAGRGLEVDSLETALARMMDEGFTHVAVQSLHTISGWEFHDLVRNARAFSGMAGGFDRVAVGGPLLNGREDIRRVAELLIRLQPEERQPGEALVLMGHGTDHPADALYTALAVELRKRDPNALLGTVEGSTGIEEIRDLLRERGVSRAYLVPFMAVAGDHARNDLAGEGEDSWKSVLSRAGVACVPVLEGTAELDPMVRIWIDHLRSAMTSW